MDENQKVNPTRSDEGFSTKTQIVENSGTVIVEEPCPKNRAADNAKNKTASGEQTISNEDSHTKTQAYTNSNKKTINTEETESKDLNEISEDKQTKDSYQATAKTNQEAQKSSKGGLFWIIIIILLLVAVPKFVSSDDTSSEPDNNLSSLSNNSEEQKLPNLGNNLGNSSQNNLSSHSSVSSEDEKDVPKKIIGNKISDSFKFKEQENIYSYTAPKSGRFIVYLDASQANADFDIKVISPSTAILKSINYVAAKYGKTRAEFAVYLTEGDTYTIKLVQDSGLCNYTIEFVAQ